MSLKSELTAVADKIRQRCSNSSKKMSISEMPTLIEEACDKEYLAGCDYGESVGYNRGYGEGHTAGYEEGYAQGEDKGYLTGYDSGSSVGYNRGYADGEQIGLADGKQAEYDAFWNSYQDNGKRLCGIYLFAGYGWNSENYKPKWKPKILAEKYPNYSTSMFERFDNIQKKSPLGINEGDIDFSEATVLEGTFRNANVAKVEMDCVPPNLTKMTGTFQMNGISTHTLTILKLGVNAKTSFDTECFRCGALSDISFIEGSVIGKAISFYHCAKLTKQSINNVFRVLSLDVTGKTLTLSGVAVDKAFEESSGNNDGASTQEWATLIATKPNWTISLTW